MIGLNVFFALGNPPNGRRPAPMLRDAVLGGSFAAIHQIIRRIALSNGE